MNINVPVVDDFTQAHQMYNIRYYKYSLLQNCICSFCRLVVGVVPCLHAFMTLSASRPLLDLTNINLE